MPAQTISPDSSGILDPVLFNRLKNELGEDLSLVIEMFLAKLPERLTLLEQTLNDNQSQAFANAAHALKGSAQNMGATALGALCLEMEHQGKSGDLTPVSTRMARLRELAESTRAALEQEMRSP